MIREGTIAMLPSLFYTQKKLTRSQRCRTAVNEDKCSFPKISLLYSIDNVGLMLLRRVVTLDGLILYKLLH